MEQEIPTDPMDVLLERTDAFEDAIIDCFPRHSEILAESSPKNELIATACYLSIEHSHVVKTAFAIDAPCSASAILRLQYEALLRAVWLLYVAPDTQVEKLLKTLDLESEQAAKNLPSNADMLKVVAKHAPQGLVAPLEEFNQNTRHALNSFVHGGIHPLQRTQHGYPMQLALSVIRFSNALLQLAYRILAGLSGSQRRMDRVTHLYKEFPDCLPMAKDWQQAVTRSSNATPSP